MAVQQQLEVAGQNRWNSLGMLLGGIAQAIAPNDWQGRLGATAGALNQQLLDQQAAQKQTGQIAGAGQQQQTQLVAMLQQLLGGEMTPAGQQAAMGQQPAVMQPTAPDLAQRAPAGGAESPFVQALLQALPKYRR